MKLIVNGETRELPDKTTVAGLVAELGLGKAPVAVEVNRDLIPRKAHASTPLNDGDAIEVVTLVGGG
jgi:sulfur carrier protein